MEALQQTHWAIFSPIDMGLFTPLASNLPPTITGAGVRFGGTNNAQVGPVNNPTLQNGSQFTGFSGGNGGLPGNPVFAGQSFEANLPFSQWVSQPGELLGDGFSHTVIADLRLPIPNQGTTKIGVQFGFNVNNTSGVSRLVNSQTLSFFLNGVPQMKFLCVMYAVYMDSSPFGTPVANYGPLPPFIPAYPFFYTGAVELDPQANPNNFPNPFFTGVSTGTATPWGQNFIKLWDFSFPFDEVQAAMATTDVAASGINSLQFANLIAVGGV